MTLVRSAMRSTVQRLTRQSVEAHTSPLRAQLTALSEALASERAARATDHEALLDAALVERGASSIWNAEFAGAPFDAWDELGEGDKELRRTLARAALTEAHAALRARAGDSHHGEA